MTWSFSALVREHGEDRAFELLAEQKGYGDFGPIIDQTDNRNASNIPDRCPICNEPWSSRRSCGTPA